MILVGRERELRAAYGALDDAAAGRGGLVLVAGEPGIGKSALAHATADRALALGFDVVWGVACQEAGAPPYWPWTQALRVTEPIERAGGTDALAALTHSLVTSGAAGPDRFALFDAVAKMLTARAARKPLLVVLEDLHDADAASVSLLAFVVSVLRRARLCIVATYRDVELRARGEAERTALIDDLAAAAVNIAPAPLSMDDIVALAALRAPAQALRRVVVERIHAASEGNSLFAQQMLELALTTKDRADAGRGDAVDAVDAVDAAALVPLVPLVPLGVRAAIRARFARIPHELRAVAEVAAVMSAELDPAVIAAALVGQLAPHDARSESAASGARSSTGDDISSVLALGVDVGLFVERVAPPSAAARAARPARRQQLSFAHGLYGETLAADLPAARRCALHARVADALEHLHAAAPDVVVARVAHHLLAAGGAHATRAIDVAQRAAALATRMLGFEEARTLLERALVLHEASHPRELRARVELVLAVALARARCGDGKGAKRACVQAAELARALGDPALLGRCAHAYGAAPSIGHTDAVLVQLIDEALSQLPTTANALQARLLARKAAALQPARDPRPPMATARHAVALVRALDDDRARLEVLDTAVAALVSFGDAAERAAWNREALVLAERLHEPVAMLRAHRRLALDTLELADVADSKSHAAAYRLLSTRFSQPHLQWPAPMFDACHALLEGRFADHARHLADARAIVERLDDRNDIGHLCVAMHALAAARDRGDAAQLEREVAELEERVSTWALADLAMPIAAAWGATICGDEASARAALQRCRVDDIVPLADIPMIGAWAAEAAAFVGDAAWMSPLYTWYRALPHGRAAVWNMHGMVVVGPIDRLLFLLARGLGLPAAVQEEHLASALALCERMAARPLAERLRAEARAERKASTASQASSSNAARVPVEASLTLEADGDRWLVRGFGVSGTVKHSRGVEMLARLLAEPGREVKALVLAGGDDALDGDAGEQIDREARDAYRARLRALRQEIEEAAAEGNATRQGRLLDEADALDRELRRAVGLGGRMRRAGAASERARSNVQRRLTDAIKRIALIDERLGAHLSRAIRTGTVCSYLPARARE